MSAHDDVAEATRQIQEAVAKALEGRLVPYTEEASRELALAALRRIPWEPHPEGGYVVRYEDGGAKVEDRWDGESLEIRRSVTLPPVADRITLGFTVDGDE
jgi:hypothetical protein